MLEIYIFFRDIGWTPVELRDDAAARVHAEINPGTLRVEDIEGRIVWEKDKNTRRLH